MVKQNQKYCNRCGGFKDTSEFNKNRTTKDGLQAYCRTHSRQYTLDSYQKAISGEADMLVSEGTIQNVQIEKVGAELLLRSVETRISDEFPCEWDSRIDFARDAILKIPGFWEKWLRLTDSYEKETDEKVKKNLRPSVDRIIENPSIGYRLENIQALSLLDNVLKTAKQSYDVINMTDSQTLTDKKKNEIIGAFSFDAEYLKQVMDGGLVSYNDKLYLFQSKDRTEGKHGEVMKELAAKSEGEYTMQILVKQPFVLKDNDGNILDRGTLTMPFDIDTRFVTAKIADSALSPEEAGNFKSSISITSVQTSEESI